MVGQEEGAEEYAVRIAAAAAEAGLPADEFAWRSAVARFLGLDRAGPMRASAFLRSSHEANRPSARRRCPRAGG
jgi:hypothetical protein